MGPFAGPLVGAPFRLPKGPDRAAVLDLPEVLGGVDGNAVGRARALQRVLPTAVCRRQPPGADQQVARATPDNAHVLDAMDEVVVVRPVPVHDRFPAAEPDAIVAHQGPGLGDAVLATAALASSLLVEECPPAVAVLAPGREDHSVADELGAGVEYCSGAWLAILLPGEADVLGPHDRVPREGVQLEERLAPREHGDGSLTQGLDGAVQGSGPVTIDASSPLQPCSARVAAPGRRRRANRSLTLF